MQISFETIISAIAIITSIVSLLYTIYSNNRRELISALMNNLNALAQIEAKIGENPDLLELHGITATQLEEINISSKELAYLLSSFTAGSIYFRTVGIKSTRPFSKESYRYKMLKSSKTRAAWKIIRENFMEPSAYMDSIDATIAIIEKEEREEV
jgi:hypothetical protein